MEDNKKMLESIREELYQIYNGEIQDENGETKSFWDYISQDVLDFNYIINADKSYKSCSLLITFGGPNIWINTDDQQIQLFWAGDHETLWLPSEICNAIDDVMEEYYNC